MDFGLKKNPTPQDTAPAGEEKIKVLIKHLIKVLLLPCVYW